MEIKTKYNVGDKVWALYKSKAERFTIQCIDMHIVRYETKMAYIMEAITDAENANVYTLVFKEHQLFPTKEELLKSL